MSMSFSVFLSAIMVYIAWLAICNVWPPEGSMTICVLVQGVRVFLLLRLALAAYLGFCTFLATRGLYALLLCAEIFVTLVHPIVCCVICIFWPPEGSSTV
jgi:hypothetical protein